MAQLVYIDHSGMAELGDGTKWRIAYDHLPRTRKWTKGSEISVTAQREGQMWPYTLRYEQTGESVSASTAPGTSWPFSHITGPKRNHNGG